MKKRPIKYFAFFLNLREQIPIVDFGPLEQQRKRIKEGCLRTGKPAATMGMELMNEAFDSLHPPTIRTLLYVLENDCRVPLHEIVRSLRDGNAK